MSFQTPITIANAIDDIDNSRLLLPCWKVCAHIYSDLSCSDDDSVLPAYSRANDIY